MSNLDFIFKKNDLKEIEDELLVNEKSSILEDSFIYYMSLNSISESQLSQNINIPTWKLRMIMTGEIKATEEQKINIAKELNCDVKDLFDVKPLFRPFVIKEVKKKGNGRHMRNKFIIDKELKGL